MKTKKLFLLLLGIWLVSLANAQESNLSVMASSGENQVSGQVILSWTLGETAVQSLTTPDGILTQGFHQPILIINDLANPSKNTDIEVIIYPNPTMNLLYLSFDPPAEENTYIVIKDRMGKTLHHARIQQDTTNWETDISKIPSGLYILTIMNDKHQLLRSFKIIKIH